MPVLSPCYINLICTNHTHKKTQSIVINTHHQLWPEPLWHKQVQTQSASSWWDDKDLKDDKSLILVKRRFIWEKSRRKEVERGEEKRHTKTFCRIMFFFLSFSFMFPVLIKNNAIPLQCIGICIIIIPG